MATVIGRDGVEIREGQLVMAHKFGRWQLGVVLAIVNETVVVQVSLDSAWTVKPRDVMLVREDPGDDLINEILNP